MCSWIKPQNSRYNGRRADVGRFVLTAVIHENLVQKVSCHKQVTVIELKRVIYRSFDWSASRSVSVPSLYCHSAKRGHSNVSLIISLTASSGNTLDWSHWAGQTRCVSEWRVQETPEQMCSAIYHRPLDKMTCQNVDPTFILNIVQNSSDVWKRPDNHPVYALV